ncbi:MAG: superinfection immunity protein [Zoogloeaceae bacterium]|jgi:hypothetical protein|nr:superinfection immunity protein [Zoogloeaceae bacterium]
MESGTRILVICVAVLSILMGLASVFGFVPEPPVFLMTIMPGAFETIQNIRNAEHQGMAAILINMLSLTLGSFMLWCMFFAPAFLALQSQHPRKKPIFLLNLLLGWTLIGWFAALFWTMQGSKQEA